MRHFVCIIPIIVFVFSIQACERSLVVEGNEDKNEFTENEIHYIVSASMPSDPETKVVLEGDSPSSPIVAKWQGSSSTFQDSFAIIGYDNDGNIALVTNAKRVTDETEDSTSGTFEFSIDTAHWVDDLEYRSFYPFYPIRDYDDCFSSGRDWDKDNWVYRFSEQSGRFEDMASNLFMTGPEINLDNPNVELQYGIAILRLSSLCIPDLKGQKIKSIKVKSNAIRDALSYRYSFKEYLDANNEITLTGDFQLDYEGKVEENLYLVFYPSVKSIEFLTISTEVDDKVYNYSYSGNLDEFTAGKVYTLREAELFYRDTSPDYDWYLNPTGEGHYFISNAKEFLGFQKIVNGDDDALAEVGLESADSFESKTIDLAANSSIDLSEVLNVGENWTPIEDFHGILNGNNSTISNLYITGPRESNELNVGLFGSVSNAIINNLTVSGVIDISGNNLHVGGIAAECSNTRILNSSSSLTIIVNSSFQLNSIGGIVGVARSSYIIGCVDTSAIEDYPCPDGRDEVGGIVGIYNSRNIVIGCSHFDAVLKSSINLNSRVGGVIGAIVESSSLYPVEACYNNASVFGRRPGQIVGGVGLGSDATNVFSCFYSGNGDAYYGIGSQNTQPKDAGTQRVRSLEEMQSAIERMNSVILEWNTANPDMMCDRIYSIESGEIVLK